MAHKKIESLEAMAREMVGDGQSPNLFFVSIEGVIVTVTRDFGLAHRQWQSLSRSQETALEDRKFGVICSTEPQDGNSKKLATWDDSQSFLRMYRGTYAQN